MPGTWNGLIQNSHAQRIISDHNNIIYISSFCRRENLVLFCSITQCNMAAIYYVVQCPITLHVLHTLSLKVEFLIVCHKKKQVGG